MGANTRNRYGITRRFGVCYMLADDPKYRALLEAYQVTKLDAQKGRAEHSAHVANIKALHEFLAVAEKRHDIRHR